MLEARPLDFGHWSAHRLEPLTDYEIRHGEAVAIGVAIGISLGAFRIVVGAPLHYFIAAGYVVVVAQTLFAPREIVPLAYDSGGVTTSTVTVPLVTALGVGLASSLRDRNPMTDGFGLIAFASLTPMIFVMAYGGVIAWI